MVVEVLVGAGDLRTYQLGDPVVWRPRASVDNGGRPDSGALDIEGYAECEKCGRSYAVDVRVRRDRFESASVRGPAFSLAGESDLKDEP